MALLFSDIYRITSYYECIAGSQNYNMRINTEKTKIMRMSMVE